MPWVRARIVVEPSIQCLSNDDLWQRWCDSKDQRARSELIERFYPLVRRVAGKLGRTLPGHVDRDDVISMGVIGLMRAIEHYDPSMGVAFETYAVPSIRGVVFDELRTQDWAPRSLRKRQREVDRATDVTESVLGRPATDAEVAETMGLHADSVTRTRREVDASYPRSLDEAPRVDMNMTEVARSQYDRLPDRTVGPDGQATESVVREKVTDLLESLPEQDKLIIALYYYYGFTLSQAGRVAGISESRASQAHTRVMLKVRDVILSMLVS